MSEDVVRKVIVIDNDAARLDYFKGIIEFLDFEAVPVESSATMFDGLSGPDRFGAVVLAPCGGASDRDELVAITRRWAPNLPIVVVSESEAGDDPVDDTAGFVRRLRMPPRHSELWDALGAARRYRTRQMEGAPRNPELFRSLVGNSPAIRKIRQLIDQVADSEANVLILGDSGTGKEVVARNLHYRSSRRNKPFVPVNCGAIPHDLLESELFGHEKGSFTGAITSRQGRFEMADGGTLFLDEIGDMSLPMQVKLLRVLQERVFERVGGNRSIKVDVRIIAATHCDLENDIREGSFREDLYYRLNVFPIEMPSLQARATDIPVLVDELVQRHARQRGATIKLTPATVAALQRYHWPGNVRELSNLVERLLIIYPNKTVDLTDLPEKYRGEGVAAPVVSESDASVADELLSARAFKLPPDGIDLKEHLGNVEYSLIMQALEEADGVVAHAAARLKLRRTTLVEKLRKYGYRSGEKDERRDFDGASSAKP